MPLVVLFHVTIGLNIEMHLRLIQVNKAQKLTARWSGPALWLFISVLIGVVSPSRTIHAEAFRFLDQSASATGQGGAFMAQADDPSAIHYNPAGMTQLHGIQASIGTNLVGGSVSYRSPTGVTTRGDLGGSVAVPPPSDLYITAKLKDIGIRGLGDTVIGLGVLSPFGLNIRYPNDGPFSTAVTSAQLPLLDVKPTLAVQVFDDLSIGVGADIYTFASFIGKGGFDQKFNSPGIGGLPPSGTPLEVNENDTAAGFNVSLLYTALRNEQGKPLANIGFVYRSQATLHLNGEFRANGALVSNANTTAVLPQIFSGGMAIWPIRNLDREWKLEFDVDYVGWKSFRNLDVHLSNGATLPFPQNWRNNYVVMLGTEHRWLHVDRLPDWEVALRGGYTRSQSPIPDNTFNPAVPESDYHGVSVGLGLLCKGNAAFLGIVPCGKVGNSGRGAVVLDVAYQALLYESRTITGNMNPTVDGTYRTVLHIGAINLRVNF